MRHFGNVDIKGKLTVKGGSAADPSINGATDPDTGLFFPGDGIVVVVDGREVGVLGRNGLRINGPAEAEGFYLSSGANLHGTAASTTLEVPGNLIIKTKDDSSTIQLQAADGSNYVRVLTSGVGIVAAEADGLVTIAAGNQVQFLESDGVTKRGVFGRDGLSVKDKVDASGFYYNPGANGVGWDLSVASLEVHLPAPTADTPYFLVNFVDQPFIVDDVKLACQSGHAAFGFYTLAAGEVYREGTGIVGTGKDGNTLGEFYVGAALRVVTATSGNVVPVNGSLKMVCLSASTPLNARGRVKIRLQG